VLEVHLASLWFEAQLSSEVDRYRNEKSTPACESLLEAALGLLPSLHIDVFSAEIRVQAEAHLFHES